MNRLEKLKNEMADHLHKTMPLHGSIGYTASKAFRDGFDAASAEYENIIAELEGALKDIYADGSYKDIASVFAGNALQKLKEFRG